MIETTTVHTEVHDNYFLFPRVRYHGFDFFFVTDRLYVEDKEFEGGYQYFQIPDGEPIMTVTHQTPPQKPVEHLEVNTKNHRYVLVGGPTIIEMYLVPIK